MKRSNPALSLMLAAPLALVLAAFLVVPVIMIGIVSFWRFLGFMTVPGFVAQNYVRLLTSGTTLSLYANTAGLLAMTLAGTLLLGYTVAYHLAFDVRRAATQTVMFALCVVPFLTSSVIRTIAWVPFLGRNGIVNTLLMQSGLIHEPLSFLLFSEFAVLLCYIPMFAGFMIAPIFNLMGRIEPAVMEAARDAGASGFQCFRWIVLPLTLPGAAIGTIFVTVMVVGDVSTVRLIGGGQIGTVAMGIANQIALVQFPPACAAAILLLLVVLVVVTPLLRFIDIRRQL